LPNIPGFQGFRKAQTRRGSAGKLTACRSLDLVLHITKKHFAAYIPFHPDCSTSYATDTEIADRPIRIFHGTPDDYNPVASCKAYLARLEETKRDVKLTEYADSEHGFDAGLLGVNAITVSTNAQTVRNFRIKEGEGGVLMNDDTKAPFSYRDDCVALNPHVGGNPATAQQARKAVSDFLQTLLKLG
jgi:dienelactone hydrolase